MPISVFKPTDDARLVASNPDEAFGAATSTGIAPAATATMVQRWDLSAPESGDPIPAGAIIDSVDMRIVAVVIGGSGDGGSGSIITNTVTRLSRTNWVEGPSENPSTLGVTYKQFAPAAGSPAGDWTTPGGDLTGKSWTFTTNTGTGVKTVTETEPGSFVEIFQGGLDSWSGIVAVGYSRETAGTAQLWASRNHATAANHPTATIEWHMPDPPEAGVFSGSRRDLRGRRRSVL